MMREIVLHGALGREFGGSFSFDVASPQEALRALVLQLKGFRERLRQGHYRIVRGELRKKNALDLEQCKLNLGAARQLHIVPVVAGAGRGSAIGKILGGIALVALAVFLPATSIAIGSLSIGVNTVIGGIGVSLALGGIASMLAPAPKLAGGSAQGPAERKDSFLFGGQVNIATQGGPVPLVYGRFEVGSVVVSAGLETQQIASTAPPPTLTGEELIRQKLSHGAFH